MEEKLLAIQKRLKEIVKRVGDIAVEFAKTHDPKLLDEHEKLIKEYLQTSAEFISELRGMKILPQTKESPDGKLDKHDLILGITYTSSALPPGENDPFLFYVSDVTQTLAAARLDAHNRQDEHRNLIVLFRFHESFTHSIMGIAVGQAIDWCLDWKELESLVAVYNQKQGGYVVYFSSAPDYQFGDVIPQDEAEQMKNNRIWHQV